MTKQQKSVYQRYLNRRIFSIIKLCKCGCGRYTKYGNDYITGHNWKNKKRTYKNKKNISNGVKILWQNKDYRNKQLKIFKSFEYRSKMSNLLIGQNSGDKHWNWKGGIDPYCSLWRTNDFRNFFKERDKNMCLNPFCSHKSDHLPLHLHHIDYDTKNCSKKNIITLCNSCNAAANKNKIWHKYWYQAILYRRYGYQY